MSRLEEQSDGRADIIACDDEHAADTVQAINTLSQGDLVGDQWARKLCNVSQPHPLWAFPAETAEFSGARPSIGLEAAPVAPNEHACHGTSTSDMHRYP
jgi:hypothetical protein